MKIIGVVRSTETKAIEIEASSYEEGRAKLTEQIPDGWQLQTIRSEKS